MCIHNPRPHAKSQKHCTVPSASKKTKKSMYARDMFQSKHAPLLQTMYKTGDTIQRVEGELDSHVATTLRRRTAVTQNEGHQKASPLLAASALGTRFGVYKTNRPGSTPPVPGKGNKQADQPLPPLLPFCVAPPSPTHWPCVHALAEESDLRKNNVPRASPFRDHKSPTKLTPSNTRARLVFRRKKTPRFERCLCAHTTTTTNLTR